MQNNVKMQQTLTDCYLFMILKIYMPKQNSTPCFTIKRNHSFKLNSSKPISRGMKFIFNITAFVYRLIKGTVTQAVLDFNCQGKKHAMSMKNSYSMLANSSSLSKVCFSGSARDTPRYLIVTESIVYTDPLKLKMEVFSGLQYFLVVCGVE